MNQLIITDLGGGKVEFSSGWRQWPLPRPIEAPSERRTNSCQWCGGHYRQDPGPDGDFQRYCSSECSYDSKNLDED